MKKVVLQMVMILLVSLMGNAESYEVITNGQQVIIGNIVYELHPDDNRAILLYGVNASGDLVIPSQITYSDQTFNVVEINGSAFFAPSNRGECKITSVVIPQSVRIIGSGAFWGCKHLKSVKILSDNIEVELSSFFNCHELSSVYFTEGITRINASTFEFCKNLKRITIPRSVTDIREYAFGKELEEIEILNPDTKIHEKAFLMCPNVKIIGWNGETYKTEGIYSTKRLAAVYLIEGEEVRITDRNLKFYFKTEEEAEKHRISEKYYINK